LYHSTAPPAPRYRLDLFYPLVLAA
jgi:hypothetical protein